MIQGSIFVKKEQGVDKVYISCYGNYEILCLMFGKTLQEVINKYELNKDTFIKDVMRFVNEKSNN